MKVRDVLVAFGAVLALGLGACGTPTAPDANPSPADSAAVAQGPCDPTRELDVRACMNGPAVTSAMRLAADDQYVFQAPVNTGEKGLSGAEFRPTKNQQHPVVLVNVYSGRDVAAHKWDTITKDAGVKLTAAPDAGTTAYYTGERQIVACACNGAQTKGDVLVEIQLEGGKVSVESLHTVLSRLMKVVVSSLPK